jgi:hypothetical protein
MNKTISSIGVIALCFGTMAMMHNGNTGGAKLKSITTSQVTSAPYRDGLYEGKLAAEHGGNRGVPRARWARQDDRTVFAAGFQEGAVLAMGQSRDNGHARDRFRLRFPPVTVEGDFSHDQPSKLNLYRIALNWSRPSSNRRQ